MAQSHSEARSSRGHFTQEVEITQPQQAAPKPKAKGGGKGENKNKRGRGPNVPEQLINKARETKDCKRLCWAFNLPNGCSKAQAGGSCDRGAHLCAEIGCQKPHSMQQHVQS